MPWSWRFRDQLGPFRQEWKTQLYRGAAYPSQSALVTTLNRETQRAKQRSKWRGISKLLA